VDATNDDQGAIPLKNSVLSRAATRAQKIDLSDQPKIDDHKPGKGQATPAEVLDRVATGFFNRIGRLRPPGADVGRQLRSP
jgi:hypothetical protein